MRKNIERTGAKWLSLAVLADLAAVGATIAHLGPRAPAPESVETVLWAHRHQETLYFWAVGALVAPCLTWLAWTTRGPHRRWLVVGWMVLPAAVVMFWPEGAWRMIRIIGRFA